MKLEQRFESFIRRHDLCRKTERILLAVSGGVDSMMMLELFVAGGWQIGVAHCNFRLRGEASDADESLVQNTARSFELPFFNTAFDTEEYAHSHGISIQMAARDLRYGWLEKICKKEGYKYIAVAQHLNDSIETVFLNLVRGTGLAGMRGILPKRGQIIRPLLFLTRSEIEQYAAEKQLSYREDASNRSTKYARNKIRIEVIPRLKELNPNFEYTFDENMRFFTDSMEFLSLHVERLRGEILQEYESGKYRIAKKDIVKLMPQRLLLAEILRPFAFSSSAIDDLLFVWDKESGKQVTSDTHIIYVDRTYLFLHPLSESDAVSEAAVHVIDGAVSWGEYRFNIVVGEDVSINKNANIAQLDADNVRFPLTIRNWNRADVFKPLGMKGKKKVSDFFVSLKIPVFEKNTVPIVTDADGAILWVAPLRIDDRYKITEETKKVITLTCIKEGR